MDSRITIIDNKICEGHYLDLSIMNDRDFIDEGKGEREIYLKLPVILSDHTINGIVDLEGVLQEVLQEVRHYGDSEEKILDLLETIERYSIEIVLLPS